MTLTRSTTLRLFKIGGVVLICALIVTYAIWRSLNYALGPEIHISSPANGATIDTGIVTIQGQALRVNNLLLNGNMISIDQMGHFNETILLFGGINLITLEANDQFGRHAEKQLVLVRI